LKSRSTFVRNSLGLTVFCLLALMFAPAPWAVPAADAEVAASDFEQTLLRQFDWVFDCQLQVVDKYLNYPGSPAKGLVIVRVTFEPALHTAAQNRPALAPLKYEELWYQNGQCVGCRRFNNLPSITNFQGAVYFRGSTGNSICDHTKEIANASVRLLTDAGLKQSIMQGVFVPWGSFGQISSDLSRSNFLPIEQISVTGKPHVSLHLIEYPRRNDQYFFYDY
jgi:hypothetical protein